MGIRTRERFVRDGRAVGAVCAAGDAGLELEADFSLNLLLPAPVRVSARDTITRSALRAADLAALGLAVAVAVLTVDGAVTLTLALFAALALVLLHACGLYARDAVVLKASLLDELPRLAEALTVAAGLTVVAGPELGHVTTAAATTAWAAACVALPATRKTARVLAHRWTEDERVLVLGSGVIADLIAAKVTAHPELGLQIVGCLDVPAADDRMPAGSALPHLGVLEDVERTIDEHRIDTVVIAFSAVEHEVLLDAIRRCKRKRVKINVVPRLFEVIGSRVELHDIEGLTLMGLRGPVRSRGARGAKRLMDVTGSVVALVLLTPVLAAIALAIKLTSRGPVIFRQERIGRGQEPFSMLKFRTMVQDADSQKATLRHLNEFAGGGMFKIANDPRTTPLGRFLRRTSLDELPQFVNVLRGEMSIVGPRPLIREENDAVLGWHRARLDLMPGLTGPWQVMGRQVVPFDEMVKLDYLYVAEWSPWNDIKLTLRTIPVMARRTGA